MIFFCADLRMQARHEAYRQTTREAVARFLEEKQATIAKETDTCEKKNCECTKSQRNSTCDEPCGCQICLQPAGCCQKDELKRFIISQAEAHPEVEFYQQMLVKYVEADIDRSKREGRQQDMEASVCLFAPHVVPIVLETLPVLRVLTEREFSMQGVISLISTVLGSSSSAKDEVPNCAKSAARGLWPTRRAEEVSKEKVCTSSCCMDTTPRCAETMGF